MYTQWLPTSYNVKQRTRLLFPYRRTTRSLLILSLGVIGYGLLRSFIQPAGAIAASPFNNFYGSDAAYYCAHYAVHGSTIAASCQATDIIAEHIQPTRLSAAHASTCHAYDDLFRQYDWSVSTAEAICQAESGGNPTAVSSTNDYGLMQLHNLAIFDPAENIAVAYQKYLMQGWSAWTTYNTGAYARFL